MTENRLAVNVFEGNNDPASRVSPNETVQQQNTQRSADQPDAKTPSSTEQGANTTTQVVTAQDDGSNMLVNSAPWIAAGVVAIVVLLALFSIIRKMNQRNRV